MAALRGPAYTKLPAVAPECAREQVRLAGAQNERPRTIASHAKGA